MELTLPEELVTKLLNPTNKISAITQVREWTNWDLKAAKEWVEQTPSSPHYEAPIQASLVYPGGEAIHLNAAGYDFRLPGVRFEVRNCSLRLLVGEKVVYYATQEQGAWEGK